MTPYWRNPWAKHAVYVPLIELARLIADGQTNIRLEDGEVVRYDHAGPCYLAYVVPERNREKALERLKVQLNQLTKK
jgi:hypothetical protein